MAPHHAVRQAVCTTEDVVGVKTGGVDFVAVELRSVAVIAAAGQLLFADQQRTRQLPACHQVARQHQKRHAACINGVGFALVVGNQKVHRFFKARSGQGQLLRSTRSLVFMQGLVTADGEPVARASGVFKIGPRFGDAPGPAAQAFAKS